jgi:uncharacterized protein YkwD
VSERYQRTSIHSTNPEGKVHEIPMKARAIDGSVAFAKPGVYRLEIVADGATGPVVLVNVPIHVGVPQADIDTPDDVADPNLTTEEAESTLLTLLNEERTKHGAPKVEADSQLRAVALAHSVDMSEHHFVGHVSPTTKNFEDRSAKAKLRLSKQGECIALAATPAGVHRGLLGSPAHRAGMLDPDFTHVGIGVAFTEHASGARELAVTLVFGRRPRTDDTALSPADIVEILQGLRRARKLPALRVDPALTTAAEAAGRALKAGKAKTPAEALAVSGRELTAAVNRTGVARTSCQTHIEIIDRYELSELSVLKRTDILVIGVGTAIVGTDVGRKLAVIVIADAGAGKTVKSCQ